MNTKRISTDDEYYIPHYRYLELKYYCLQYPVWTAAHSAIAIMLEEHPEKLEKFQENAEGTPEMRAISALRSFETRIDMVNSCAERAAEGNDALRDALIVCTTKGLGFKALKTDITSKQYSEAYRKFFYYLSQERS